jgi:hypothetical protein
MTDIEQTFLVVVAASFKHGRSQLGIILYKKLVFKKFDDIVIFYFYYTSYPNMILNVPAHDTHDISFSIFTYIF